MNRIDAIALPEVKALVEAVSNLQTYLEIVLPDDVWEGISVEKWNAVTQAISALRQIGEQE
jgi:DNA-binding winged helix-turn-helix (wHTH) protein